jgi:hypothetical protein
MVMGVDVGLVVLPLGVYGDLTNLFSLFKGLEGVINGGKRYGGVPFLNIPEYVLGAGMIVGTLKVLKKPLRPYFCITFLILKPFHI